MIALPAVCLFLLSSFPFSSSAVSNLKDTTPVYDALTHPNDYCNLSGRIHDSCCDYETVEKVNDELAPVLEELVKTPFFKYYKLDLHKGCPFWEENHLCTMRDCSVETLDESEIPENLRAAALSALHVSPYGTDFQPFERCENNDLDFCVLDDELSSAGVYVNLRDNPERFTGYAGNSANRIWRSIYEENCFNLVDAIGGSQEYGSKFASSPSSPFSPFSASFGAKNALPDLVQPGDRDKNRMAGACLEKRVFYRLISGLHSSISIHICDEYLNQTTGEWGRNLDCFMSRISSHPERLQNVYFNYVLLLRAVTKISNYLENYTFCNDLIVEGEEGAADDLAKKKGLLDRRVKELVGKVLHTGMSCPSTFDEHVMFADKATAQGLKDEFKNHFRNITRIMDCVSCEKCRLWGKLQTTGLGTALKILFSLEETEDVATRPVLTFQRTEIVALFNTLARFSESIRAIEGFRNLYKERVANEKRDDRSEKSATTNSEGGNGKPDQEVRTKDKRKAEIVSEKKKSDDAKPESDATQPVSPTKPEVARPGLENKVAPEIPHKTTAPTVYPKSTTTENVSKKNIFEHISSWMEMLAYRWWPFYEVIDFLAVFRL